MASTNQKISFLFYPNKQRTRNGEAQIYVRLYIESKRAEFSTNFYVSLSDWDTKKSKVKNTHKSALLINNKLEKIRSEINHLFVLEITQKGSTTSKEIRDKYLGRDVEEQPKHKTILEAFDYHNLKLSEQVKIGKVVAKTHARYIITKNKVEVFMQHQNKKDNMPLPEMRLRFVTEFEHYLLTVDKLQSNTAHKYIKNLKKIMNTAVGLDWIPSNPFNQFKCSYTNPEREILNQDVNFVKPQKLLRQVVSKDCLYHKN